MLTLDWLLEHTTEDTEVIIRSHGPPLSAGELRAAVAAQAQALASRLAGSARSVVAVAQSDPARQLLSLLAAIEAGAVPMPLDARAPLESLIAQCTRARATLLIRDEDDLGFPEPASGPAPNIGLVLATSGSSGAPRAVALRSAGLRANVEAILGYLPVRRHGRTAVVLPFVSGYAVVGQAFTTLRAGGCLLLAAGLTWPAAQLDFLTRGRRALERPDLASTAGRRRARPSTGGSAALSVRRLCGGPPRPGDRGARSAGLPRGDTLQSIRAHRGLAPRHRRLQRRPRLRRGFGRPCPARHHTLGAPNGWHPVRPRRARRDSRPGAFDHGGIRR